jgi:hypothetical protein
MHRKIMSLRLERLALISTASSCLNKNKQKMLSAKRKKCIHSY